MPPLRALFALVIAAVPSLAPTVSAQATPSPVDLAARIQAHYANVRDFTADFTLTLTSGLSRRTETDRGKVAIKKPGRMRWVYETGTKLELVADGSQIYWYFPNDDLVRVTPLPKDNEASSALLLLTGRGDLTRDFVPAGTVEAPAGEWRLTVKPKVPQADFTSLTLAVDRTTLALRGLVVNEQQGGVRQFTFERLKENAGLSDTRFAFKIPPGVEVQR